MWGDAMSLRVMLVLSAADKEALVQAQKKNPNSRIRERALSILLLAQLQDLAMRAVSHTCKRWIAAGLAAFP
jgi:hypothetical protein